MFDDSLNSKVLGFAFGLTAEIEHQLISQRTREAMTVGKAQGRHMGRKKGSGSKMKLLEKHREDIETARASGVTIAEICRLDNVSYNTYYRFIRVDKDGKN